MVRDDYPTQVKREEGYFPVNISYEPYLTVDAIDDRSRATEFDVDRSPAEVGTFTHVSRALERN